MTDNEIIKALECCISDDDGTRQRPCNGCPLLQDDACSNSLRKLAFDLINRQKAEIEKLNVELVGMRGACESYKMHYDNAQAEIERLQNDRIVIQLDDEVLLKDFKTEVKKEINTIKSEAYREFAEILRTTNSTVENVLNKLLSNDMGRYDHYTDSFVKETAESNE